jgi:predicted deacylase
MPTKCPACWWPTTCASAWTCCRRRAAFTGEVVLVPAANPIGMAQRVLHGTHQGRFDLASGENFNRHYTDLTEKPWPPAVHGRLGSDAAANVALVRAALREAVAAMPGDHPAGQPAPRC